MTGDNVFSEVEPDQQQETAHRGWVFWVTGLSGAGKTTIGRTFFSILARHCPLSIFLDGEQLRRVVMPEAGYSMPERLECARRYGLLCKLVSEQGMNVVVATISMFDECRRWNRANLSNYFEVYLRVSCEVLAARDRKRLYTGEPSALPRMVVGDDLPCEYPSNSDITIDNDGSRTPENIAEFLWQEASARIRQKEASLET